MHFVTADPLFSDRHPPKMTAKAFISLHTVGLLNQRWLRDDTCSIWMKQPSRSHLINILHDEVSCR